MDVFADDVDDNDNGDIVCLLAGWFVRSFVHCQQQHDNDDGDGWWWQWVNGQQNNKHNIVTHYMTQTCSYTHTHHSLAYTHTASQIHINWGLRTTTKYTYKQIFCRRDTVTWISEFIVLLEYSGCELNKITLKTRFSTHTYIRQ